MEQAKVDEERAIAMRKLGGSEVWEGDRSEGGSEVGSARAAEAESVRGEERREG